MSEPVNKAMFGRAGADHAPDELDRWADEGVRAFLAAYGQDDQQT